MTKPWCTGKKQIDIDHEFFRELGTMERDDLIDLVESLASKQYKRNMINNWHENDEEPEGE